jgi:hypothetical protein
VNIRVEVQYAHPLFLPLVSIILDGFDGTGDGALRIGTAEEIRVENATTSGPPSISGSQCVTS